MASEKAERLIRYHGSVEKALARVRDFERRKGVIARSAPPEFWYGHLALVVELEGPLDAPPPQLLTGDSYGQCRPEALDV